MDNMLNILAAIGGWVPGRIATDDFVLDVEGGDVRSAILDAVAQWCDEDAEGQAVCAMSLADFAVACGDAINEDQPENDYVLWDSTYRPDDPLRDFEE